MATYSPHGFLRQCGNVLLAEYFQRLDCLHELKIAKRKQTDVEPLIEACAALETKLRQRIEGDFHCVHDLANARGVESLHRTLQHEGGEFPDFGKQRGYHDKALWAFLHHRSLFEAVHKFTMPHASRAYWHTFAAPEGALFDNSPATQRALAASVSRYFRTLQGRGEHCQIEAHAYEGKDFVFLYPSSYFETHMLYEEQQFVRRITQPAFEVVVVWHHHENLAEVYHHGSRSEAWELFQLYAKHFLGMDDIGERPKQAYNLEAFKAKTPPRNIIYPAESRVEEIAVCKLKFAPLNHSDNTITIEGNVVRDRNATYAQLKETGLTMGTLKQIGLAVWMQGDAMNKPQKFDISPTACRLGHHGRDKAIREFLQANAIVIRD
jgi:hypothetical protein